MDYARGRNLAPHKHTYVHTCAQIHVHTKVYEHTNRSKPIQNWEQQRTGNRIEAKETHTGDGKALLNPGGRLQGQASGETCLLTSLTTWVQPASPITWERGTSYHRLSSDLHMGALGSARTSHNMERGTSYHRLSSDLHMGAMACTHPYTHIINKQVNTYINK